MFELLILVVVAGIGIGEVADVPMGATRQTLPEVLDCAKDKNEYLAHCAFPAQELQPSGAKGAN